MFQMHIWRQELLFQCMHDDGGQWVNSLDSYRKTSNVSRTLVGNKIVDHSDVVGASPGGTAPTTSSFST